MPLRREYLTGVLREPLLHFLLIGAAIFGFYSLGADRGVRATSDLIVVSSGDVERLSGRWEKRWRRPPTPNEVRDLIAEHIREEVLYREALALGLDRDDSVIRRRLRQKFEFVTQDLAVARDPDGAELSAFYETNRKRYRMPPRFSFNQVFFNTDRRGGAGERDARLALASLRDNAGEVSLAGLGDGHMLDDTYRDAAMHEITALFGAAFAEALARLDLGVWSGPIASGYGLHLVRLNSMEAGKVAPLDQIEERVRNDWAYEQRQQANEAIYQKLRARYEVVVEDVDVSATLLETGKAGP
jgi:hypothetical protein